MTIKQAKEILQNMALNPPPFMTDLERQALSLAIEALKAEERRRRFTIPVSANLLPGETKE